ncbi:hypothetical protein F5Y11DRAFT_79361 [Daldinia sp. FL1419]|nr:hypothetical protein F5Y11DRAFT_79361 [Daldinia sp. FL1419]
MISLSVPLLIFLEAVSGSAKVGRKETTYPTCGSLSTFSIQNQPTDSNRDADFTFHLSTGFDDYASLCSGQWRGVETEWQVCDKNSEDSSTLFRGTASGYLDVAHRYLCKRPGESEGKNTIALAIANGTVILNFSKEDIHTFNAYIKMMH